MRGFGGVVGRLVGRGVFEFMLGALRTWVCSQRIPRLGEEAETALCRVLAVLYVPLPGVVKAPC